VRLSFNISVMLNLLKSLIARLDERLLEPNEYKHLCLQCGGVWYDQTPEDDECGMCQNVRAPVPHS
jgi:rubrerythrin